MRLRYAPPLWAGIVGLVTFFADISVAGTLLPFFVEDILHTPPARVVGIATSFQYASATVGLVLTGALADCIGLRRTIMLACTANMLLLNVQGFVRSVPVLMIVRCLIGSVSTYALGLSWVAMLAPPSRLARWMAWTVCAAQAGISGAGLIAGSMRGRDLYLASAIVSVLPATAAIVLAGARDPVLPKATVATSGDDVDAPQRSSAPLRAAFRHRYLQAVAVAPFVQGTLIGGIFQVLTPYVLKTTHGFREDSVARVFQLGGLGALIAHAVLTPWLSSRPWRHRAAQALSLITAAALVVYGALGDQHPAVALALPTVAFVCTAINLGICNLMIAMFAMRMAPEALGRITGLTRCLFTLGWCSLPALLLPLRTSSGLLAPCGLVAGLFTVLAILLQFAAHLPEAPSSYAAAASGCSSSLAAEQEATSSTSTA